MNEEETEELGKRAAACKGWRWIPGMLDNYWDRILEVNDEGEFIYSGSATQRFTTTCNHFPDLNDGATVGCLLDLVRQAWNDEHMWVEFDENHWAAMRSTGDRSDVAVSTASEAHCLVRALEAKQEAEQLAEWCASDHEHLFVMGDGSCPCGEPMPRPEETGESGP